MPNIGEVPWKWIFGERTLVEKGEKSSSCVYILPGTSRKGTTFLFCFIYLFIYLYLYRICPFSKADINGGPDKLKIKYMGMHRNTTKHEMAKWTIQ